MTAPGFVTLTDKRAVYEERPGVRMTVISSPEPAPLLITTTDQGQCADVYVAAEHRAALAAIIAGTAVLDGNVRVIVGGTSDDVLPGDYLTWERTWTDGDVTFTERRANVAHHRRPDGHWFSAKGLRITGGGAKNATLTIYRPTPEDGAQIIPADKAIEAVWGEVTYTTTRATYDATENIWVGIWRGAGNRSTYEMHPEHLTPGTWRKA